MKLHFASAVSSLAFLLAPSGLAQTLNWDSELFSDLVDSSGQTLDQAYIFEIGSFADDFTPNSTNLSDWSNHWRIFDAASYNGMEDQDDGIHGYFTSSVQMRSDGTSASPFAAEEFNFNGLQAYLWVRNSDVPESDSEWFLARADDWSFPIAFPGCCDNDLPISWSLNDLDRDEITPIWGAQSDLRGSGSYTDGGSYTLQTHNLETYTPVPEPSSVLLLGTAGLVLIGRRHRKLN